MPETDYAWLPKDTLLSFEEIAHPRRCLLRSRRRSRAPDRRRAAPAPRPHLRSLACWRRGRRFAISRSRQTASCSRRRRRHCAPRACIASPSASIRCERDRFRALTRFDSLSAVLDGIAAAAAADFDALKIDTVVIRGVNDDELVDLIEYGRTIAAEVRFIEYMDVGGATRWTSEAVVSRRDILAALERHYGAVTAVDEESQRPQTAFCFPTARSSASFRRRLRLFATPATAAASPRMASG